MSNVEVCGRSGESAAEGLHQRVCTRVSALQPPNSARLMNSFGNEINSRPDRTICRANGWSRRRLPYLLSDRRPQTNDAFDMNSLVYSVRHHFVISLCAALSLPALCGRLSGSPRASLCVFIWFIAFARHTISRPAFLSDLSL